MMGIGQIFNLRRSGVFRGDLAMAHCRRTPSYFLRNIYRRCMDVWCEAFIAGTLTLIFNTSSGPKAATQRFGGARGSRRQTSEGADDRGLGLG